MPLHEYKHSAPWFLSEYGHKLLSRVTARPSKRGGDGLEQSLFGISIPCVIGMGGLVAFPVDEDGGCFGRLGSGWRMTIYDA